ncbi:Na+/H+ antiporter NhaC family protein [Tenuibacillus multivorans]|uniref:Na+/H+ antiporter NhaC n=1 Tax=Tenuibacillus multivorans TaxID=237069 RepID=A0A1H0FUJ3_9BACI|nr:Na+/H+ antiporter NhaC family protein [Tenuibacillus multivorans]GEL77874.1 Na+/H+ antiporter [Tenuibacillus multivorans]SDN98254.1 Na+/H+ antiporter NhaC [Tenuibacillus multivorans]
MDFVGTAYSLIPPLVMIILVLITRKVLLSLGVGIIVGTLMVESFNPIGTLEQIWISFQGNFYSEGEWALGSFQLLGFLILLGILIAFLTATGGARAFGNWATKKIRTREGSQYSTGLLGLVIFIDDYFSSLSIGQISRPLTDRYKVSRAKLAYLIDSTAAPVTIMSPVSSWGASIIGIIALEEFTDTSAFNIFIGTIPFNYYAIAAILLVFLSIKMNLDFGPMREHEIRAKDTGELIDPLNSEVPGDLQDDVKENANGRPYHLIIPIVMLVVSTVAIMAITGLNAVQTSGDDVTLLNIFGNSDVNYSLFFGGLISVLIAVVFYLLQKDKSAAFISVVWEGIKAMLPAIYILILAWMIVNVIGNLETGEYLGEVVRQSNFNVLFLPLIVFVISGIMAFATGTSWGTFGIMIPLAGGIVVETDPSLLVPTLAATLAGSVFGDHCSPISDTTVLSSTGAGSNHIDHVLTQIPYAVLAALASVLGYVFYGLTSSMLVGLIVTIGVLVLLSYIIHLRVAKR